MSDEEYYEEEEGWVLLARLNWLTLVCYSREEEYEEEEEEEYEEEEEEVEEKTNPDE